MLKQRHKADASTPLAGQDHHQTGPKALIAACLTSSWSLEPRHAEPCTTSAIPSSAKHDDFNMHIHNLR